MNKFEKQHYLSLMKRNISLAYIKTVFLSMLFFIPIWYSFETQFADISVLTVVYALTHIVCILLELPSGALADLIGRKKTIFLGLLIQGFSWFLLSQAKSLTWIWSGYIINAVSNALVSGSDTALHYDSLKELGKEKFYAKFSSNTGLVFRIGMIFSTFIGGLIIPYKLTYLMVAVSTTVAGLLTFFNTEPNIDSEKFSLESYIQQTKIGIKELFKNEYIKDFSIYYVAVGGITWYYIYFLAQVFASQVGFSPSEKGIIFSFVFIVGALTNIFIVRNKWFTREKVYILFPILMVLGYLPGFWATKTIAIICFFLARIAAVLRFSLLDQYANLEFDSKYRATAISALNMLVSIVFVVLSLLFSLIIGQYGSSLIMTILGILTLIFTVPPARVLLSKHRGSRE
jgi:MFS family permease